MPIENASDYLARTRADRSFARETLPEVNIDSPRGDLMAGLGVAGIFGGLAVAAATGGLAIPAIAAGAVAAGVGYDVGAQGGAAFEESFIGKAGSGLVDNIYWSGVAHDPGYDAFDSIERDGMGPYAASLIDSQSDDEYQARKSTIMRSIDNDRILSEGGVASIGTQFVWGGLDPVNLAPVLGASVKAYRTTKSIAAAAGAAAAVGGASQAAQELALSQFDPTYDPASAPVAIGANAVLSGILGPAAMSVLSPEVRKSFTTGFDSWRDTTARIDDPNFGQGTVGAAQVKLDDTMMTKEQLEPLSSGGIGNVAAMLSRQTRLMRSLSEKSRQYNAILHESAQLNQGNVAGTANPISIETEMKLFMSTISEARAGSLKAFTDYRKSVGLVDGVAGDIADVTGISARRGALTHGEFDARVAMAMRRGDKDTIDGNQFIEAAARSNRKWFETLKNEAINVGIFEKTPDLQGTAESYFSRVYNQDAINSNPQALEALIGSYYKQERDRVIAQIPIREAQLQEARVARDTLRRSLQKTATTQRQEERALVREMSRADGKITAYTRDIKRLQSKYRELEKRAVATEPMDLGGAQEYVKELYKDVRGNPMAKYEKNRLLPTIRKLGGIAEDQEAAGPNLFGAGQGGENNRGDIRVILDKEARTIFRKDGLPLDKMREALAERGWLPEDSDINDLLNLIEQDAKLTPVYDPAVLDGVLDAQSRIDMVDNIDQEFSDRLGISLAQVKSAKELEYYLGKLNGGEDFKEFAPSTTAQRAKYREMQFNMRRYEQTLEKINNDLDQALTDNLNLKTALDDVRANRTTVAEVLKQGRKELGQARKGVDSLVNDLEDMKWRGSFEDAELADIATKTVQRIQKGPMGLVSYDDIPDSGRSGLRRATGARGALKERKLLIPDNYEIDYNGGKIRFEDFLVNDPLSIMQAQLRTVAPDILLAKRFGTVDGFQVMKNEVTADYAKLINQAKTAKEKAKLARQREKDLLDLEQSIQILRGQYGHPDDYYSLGNTSARLALQANYLRLMGEVTVSSFADIGSIVLNEGLVRTMGGAFDNLVQGIRKSDLRRMAKEDLELLSLGSESVMNDRFMKMTEIDVYSPATNRIERAGNYAAGVFQKVTFMNVWLDGMRKLAGILFQDTAIKAALAGKLSKAERARLAGSFLDQKTLDVIRDQFIKHGGTERGVFTKLHYANMRNWDVENPEVAAALFKFRAAIVKEVDTMIIKPGSDRSTKFGKTWGKLFFQFKSFPVVATNRILTRSAQRIGLGDLRVLSGVSTMVGFGAMSYAVKAALQGKETSDDYKVWISEGIDRSGVLGILGDVNNITEKVTGNNFGVRPALGVAPATRYINRNFLETLGGPTAGLVQDTGEIIQSVSKYGEPSQSDLKKMRRMLPFQNALGFRYLFDGIEQGVSDTFNLPEKR